MGKRRGKGTLRFGFCVAWRNKSKRFWCYFAKLLRAHHHRLVKWGALVTGLLSIATVTFIMMAKPDSGRPSFISAPLTAIIDAVQKPAEPPLTGFDLSIPKIDLWVPVVADVDGYDQKAYVKALASGVAHFKDTAKPDDAVGNVFIFGHSTDWQWNEGNYKTVFRNLPDLKLGDEIIVYYQNSTYKYSIDQKEIVPADDLIWLASTKDKVITLMTCYPIGSNDKRLVVRGKIKP